MIRLITSAVLVLALNVGLTLSHSQSLGASGSVAASLSDPAVMQRDQQRSRQLSPDDRDRAVKLFDQAFLLWQAGNLDAAKLGFERGLGIDPSNGTANYYLGDILGRRGDAVGARVRYERAVFFDPDSSGGLAAQVALEAMQKKTAEENASKTEADLRLAQKIASVNATLRSNGMELSSSIGFEMRGRAYIDFGRFDQAINEISEAIRLTPDRGSLWYSRGLISYRVGAFADAARDFERSQTLDENGVGVSQRSLWARLMLYLARSRSSGVKDTKYLVPPVGQQLPDLWPRPIIDHFMGRISGAALRAAAPAGLTDLYAPARDCDLPFFLGQQALILGDKTEALRHLGEHKCTGSFLHLANQDLVRLRN